MEQTDNHPGRPHCRLVLPGIVTLCALLVLSLISTGCAQTLNSSQLTSAAARADRLRVIAADYARNDDLGQAQVELDKLGLANPAQLLVSLAESDLSAGSTQEQVAPLARLAEVLGARSPKLAAYLTPTEAPSPTAAAPSAPPPPTGAPTALPTQVPPAASPAPATATLPAVPTDTVTPESQKPRVVADGSVNLRSGPGRTYPVIGRLQGGQEVEITGRNASGDWWRLAWTGADQAWVAGTVVRVLGAIDTVAVAQNIPTPPPAPTSAPRPTAAPTAPPQPAGPEFRLESRRLWTVEETGGFLAGTSVNCGGQHTLHVYVKDAAGNLINGVTVREVGGNQQELVSGSKGPGMVEYDLYPPGKDVMVVRDADGRQVTSDTGAAPSITEGIPFDILMGARYCTDAADCAHFLSERGCNGHYSWDVIFRRAY